jgi:phospholipase C
MRAIRVTITVLALAAALVYVAALNSCSGGSSAGSSGNSSSSSATTSASPRIQHVVIIFQENRTPDNLFHGLPNADIANTGVNSSGQTIVLQPTSLAGSYDLGHKHSDFVSMYDNGKMDKADQVTCEPVSGSVCPPNPQFLYVNPSEVAPYFQLAQQYTFGDRMFQTQQGPSFPAHQFIISGTSAPTATSNLFAAENPYGGAGCVASSDSWVWMIDAGGNESSQMYPCFEHQTLTDLLDQAGISWKYYTPSAGSIWTGPNAIQHICGAVGANCAGAGWMQNVILQNTRILTDISSGQLPAVSWVIPSGQASDHPVFTDGSGPSWVASIVNAIGNSAYWSNTAIIITWDDWGGWYDHVPPPSIVNDGTGWGSGYVYGFRVPLIVVSPYAKAAYVSHVTHDFGSILKFVEQTFGLGSLGYADSRADDLSDCFDFHQSPLPFRSIAAPVSAAHFLNDKNVPSDPDND